MIHKPEIFDVKYAEPFKDASVVEAYRYRPPYPSEIFDLLEELLNGVAGPVLDVGCGSGDIARHLVERVERLDAVDFSRPMLDKGKQLPNGKHPRLRWLHGRIEDIELEPPYGLITAGESIHWLDWHKIFPRFRQMLKRGGYLAIMRRDIVPVLWSPLSWMLPHPWPTIKQLIQHYSISKTYLPFNVIEVLEQNGLFHKVNAKTTAPIPFEQPIEEYIESFHSRSGFPITYMGQEKANAFDRELRALLLDAYPDGMLSLQLTGSILWGIPIGE